MFGAIVLCAGCGGKSFDVALDTAFKKLFRSAHTKMDYDPDVWLEVENLILRTVRDPPRPPAEPFLR